jgi:hypothetical protein
MSVTTWSWLLAALNLFTLFLAWQVGNKRRSAFLGYLAVEAIWIAFAIDTASWGFVVSAIAFAAIAMRNYLKWGEATPPVELHAPSQVPR